MVLVLHTKNTWIKSLALYKKKRFVYILVSYCDNDGAVKGKLKHIFEFWTDNVHPIRYHQWRYRYSVPLPSVTIRHCLAGYLLLGHSFQREEKGSFPPGATQPIVGVYFTALYRALASSRTRLLDHTQRRVTVGRTPLNEWSVRRRDLYLTSHNTHNRQTSMPRVRFKPMIAAGERP
jgi:hypothetical protein